MIRIDNISFEFTAPDEKFAHELYADWDGFCRRCFEQVVEECLSTYDKEKVLYEIEQLELDLGSIPEEYFYREFLVMTA
ncbi:MAG: contractile injection system tape measure protein [Parabacteroides sp.]